MDEITQRFGLDPKQACTDLEKATQLITKMLQHEVSRNSELCIMMCRMEEKEAEMGRSLGEQLEANQQLQMKIKELQKQVELKDHSLTKAEQMVTFLKNKLGNLQQELHKQLNEDDRGFQDSNELQQNEANIVEDVCDSDGMATLLDDPKILEQSIFGKEDVADEYVNSNVPGEETNLSVEGTSFSEADIKTEQIEEEDEEDEEEVKPVLAPGVISAMSVPLSLESLAMLNGASQRLVDSWRPQGQAIAKEEGENEEGPAILTWPGQNLSSRVSRSSSPPTTSSFLDNMIRSSIPSMAMRRFSLPPLPLGLGTLPMLQQDSSSEGPSFHTGEDSPVEGAEYKCTHCDRAFTRKTGLARHQLVHSGERPYRCPYCDKAFGQVGTLKVHLNTHTGERPYPCNHCGKRFSRVAGLRIHLRVHTGEKPHHCEVCGKSFNVEGNLTVHLRTHTGERPFLCTLCGKRFSTKGNMKKHQQNHYKGTPPL